MRGGGGGGELRGAKTKYTQLFSVEYLHLFSKLNAFCLNWGTLIPFLSV